MRSHAEITKAAGPQAVVEAATDRRDVSIHTVRSWIQRDSIPPDLWPVFVEQGWASLDELAAGVSIRKQRDDTQERAA